MGAIDYISLILGLVGVVPIAISTSYLINRWTKVRRVLRFGTAGRVDLVLTTSQRQRKSQGGKATVVRHLSPEGDILAIAAAVACISKNYRSKNIVTHVSDRVRGTLDDDLVVFGSPASNRCSSDFFSKSTFIRSLNLVMDVPNCTIHIDTETKNEPFTVVDFDIMKDADWLPRRDLVVIAIGQSPYNKDRRAVVCAGYTTYGTGAAGEILFSQILAGADSRCRELRQVIEHDSALLVIECGLEVGKLVHWNLLFSAFEK